MRFGSLRTPFPCAHPGLADGQEAARCFRNERHQTMSETTPDTDTRSTYHIGRNPQQEPHPHSAGHTAGTSTRLPRNHHLGNNPSRRPPVSQEQRQKLSAAQKAYVANDPRWPEHRRKLAAAQEAKRMTLMENEVALIVKMRKTGRTFDYIAEEIGVCRDVIGRELTALGISTAPVKADRRARRGRGFWRCFD